MAGCWDTYADYAHGSKGSAIIMASLQDPKPRIYNSQEMTPEKLVWEYGQPDNNPYDAEWQLLVDAIRHDTPHNEARRAGEADVAALMGRIATHTGQVVTWDQVMASDFQFVDHIDDITWETPAPIQEGPGGIYPAPSPGVTKEC